MIHPGCGPAVSVNIQELSILSFIDKKILQHIKPTQNKLQSVSKRFFQSLGLVSGLFAGAPYIRMNQEAGGDNQVYGGALIAASCAAYTSLVSYSILEFIDEITNSVKSEEPKLFRNFIGTARKIVLVTSSFFLGFLAQIPFAYTVYLSGGSSVEKVAMPIMVMVIDAWIAIYPTYMQLKMMRPVNLLKAIRKKTALEITEKELSNTGLQIARLIGENLQTLRRWSKEERNKFFQDYLKKHQEGKTTHDPLPVYKIMTSRLSSSEQSQKNLMEKVAPFIVRIYGYTCGFSFIGTLTYSSWEGTATLIDSVYGRVSVTAAYFISSIYLDANLVPKTASHLYEVARSLINRSYTPTQGDQLSPKLSIALKSAGLSVAMLSYGNTVQMSEIYYKGIPFLNILMKILLSSCNFFLFSMTSLSVAERIIEYKVAHFGSDEDKKVLKIYKEIECLKNLFFSAKEVEIARFIQHLDPADQETLVKNTNLTPQAIESYISYCDSKKRMDERTSLIST